MRFKVLHLYNKILDLYGDKGNIETLRYRCEQRGIDFQVDTLNVGDPKKNFLEYNLIFMGGGSDFEQSVAAKDLLTHKEDILAAMKEGAFVLLICGAYQLFGQYYIDAKGNKIKGLGIFDYYTEAEKSGKRCTGNVLIESDIPFDFYFNDGAKTEAVKADQGQQEPKVEKIKIIGFENHVGQTYDVKNPFGRVLVGNGNSTNAGVEGVMTEQVIGTYLHGPLLPRNPRLADYVIYKGLAGKGQIDRGLSSLNNDLEDRAFRSMESRLLKDMGQ